MYRDEVRKLVKHWIDERVEINSEYMTKTNDEFDDFLEWLREQEEREGPVYAPQWSSAMKQRGFKAEHYGSDWFIRGIKLQDN